MINKLAKLTSNVLNPFLASFIIFILLSFESASGTSDALKWASISIALSVLPVFLIVVYLVHIKKLTGIFINPRRQRTKVYLMASAWAIIGCIVMVYTGAPKLLLATFAAGLAAIVIFMGINLWWKISLHTAFMAASVTVLIIIYGIVAVWTVSLLLLVAWARIELKLHSPAQVIIASLLTVIIVVIVYRCFGLI